MRLAPGDSAPTFVHKPVFGRPLDLAQLTARRPLVLVFLRYIGAHGARATALELLSRFDELDIANVAVAAVTEGSLVELRDFVPRHHVRYPVLHDAEGALYDAFGVGLDPHPVLGAMRQLTPGSLRRVAQSLPAGHGRPDGASWARLPAAFVLDRGPVVRWAWYAESLADEVPVDTLVLSALDAVR